MNSGNHVSLRNCNSLGLSNLNAYKPQTVSCRDNQIKNKYVLQEKVKTISISKRLCINNNKSIIFKNIINTIWATEAIKI